ncbi:hypothetical protein [Halobellus salinisoli]|uniref:hypothetical protein n=1 Tax=Halobellus salinisoli TaxID=3108500 RepID=UPI00300BF705
MVISSAATLSPVAVLDTYGDIVEVNQAWKAFGERNGVSKEYTSVGKNYVAISEQADDIYGERVATQLRRLLSDEQTGFTVVYPCHSPNQKRWFRLYATAVSFGGGQYYLLVHQQLDRDSPSRGNTPSDGVDAPTRNADHRDRNRLVTYNLSPDESANDGLLMAFDAIGVDVQRQDTTLVDWIDPDVINGLQTITSEFYITFDVWNYPVALTSDKVIIYTPEGSST